MLALLLLIYALYGLLNYRPSVFFLLPCFGVKKFVIGFFMKVYK